MLKQILLRATKISVLFAVAFFIINYIGMEKPDILYLVGRTIIATLAFILICLTVFTDHEFSRAQDQTRYDFTDCINYWYHFRRHIFNGTNRCHHWVNHRCDCYVYLESIEKNKGGRSS